MTEQPRWDWLKMVPSWTYHELVLDDWPDWDKKDNEPASIRLSFRHKEELGSRQVAIQWDDSAQGQFYYRDYTKSGLPFVDEGEVYESLFVFQYITDAVAFHGRYGGTLRGI